LVTAMLSGCLPMPVSTVALHTRSDRPFALESAPSEKGGAFSSPAFDRTGEYLAVYESGANLIRVLRASDLASFSQFVPARRPKRLQFSPHGRFLIVELHPGWVSDRLSRLPAPSGVSVDSADTVLDDIERVEVWDLAGQQIARGLSCDAAETTDPQGGWLWARKKVISSGYRSSAILASRFSPDESVFSILCWNGMEQRWSSGTWQRLEDTAPPLFWGTLTRGARARYWTENQVSAQSEDGGAVVLSVREKSLGFGTAYFWNRTMNQPGKLSGNCGTRVVPDHALSGDETKVALVCNSGLGYALRAWDLSSEREIPLKGADFGMTKGAPLIRSEGVALSPDGRYMAAALLNLTATMASSRSDLRVWDLERGVETAALPIEEFVPPSDYFQGADLSFSPDSKMLAIAGKRLRVYRLSDLSTTAK
jgi:WD40 repeat protein